MSLVVSWVHALLLVAGSLGVVAGLMLWGLVRFINAPCSHGTWVRPWLIRLDYQLHFGATALGVGLLGGLVLAGALWHGGLSPGPTPPVPSRVEPAPEGAVDEAPPPPAAAPEAFQAPRDSPPVPGPDAFPLAGEWQVVNTVLQTQYAAYRQLRLTFRLVVQQQGATFTATGAKYLENGQLLPRAARRPLMLQGTLKAGAVIEATFQEAGLARPTHGRFRLTILSRNHLRGTFASTAAGASGSSQWFRVHDRGGQ